jgi:hypothetical protein
VAIHAFLTPVIASHGVAWQSMPFSPLSLRATEWRGNPAEHFGIPDYDTDRFAASAFQAFLAMTGWESSRPDAGNGARDADLRG